jgi:hypothetical protein
VEAELSTTGARSLHPTHLAPARGPLRTIEPMRLSQKPRMASIRALGDMSISALR